MGNEEKIWEKIEIGPSENDLKHYPYNLEALEFSFFDILYALWYVIFIGDSEEIQNEL